ncbi:MAG: right-handed parallel beta-helix repeat-containing protein [Aureispira sp.]
MKELLGICLIMVMAIACKKIDRIAPEPGIIDGETFNSTVLIDGHAYDGTVFRNCIFEDITGDGLQIRDVDSLCIENCIFRNISGDGIRFRNTGSSNNVKILTNEFYSIEENAILAPEDHLYTLIKGNTIHDVATNNASSQVGAPHHGIYFQGNHVVITENKIYNVSNDQGNGISIRTNGTITKNVIYNTTDHGISYFSDHPGNGDTLLIQNNIIYDNGKRAVNLASNGNTSNHVGTVVVRFNTLLSNTSSVIGINDRLTGVTIDLMANIAVRTDGGSTYVFSTLPYNQSKNLTASGDIGFVDFTNRDLHLGASSTAENFATGIANFPVWDIDFDRRAATNLDAGADER